MKLQHGFALAVVACCIFALAGCEGDAGPQGPPGPPGGTFEFTFIGEQGAACLHCHTGNVEMWETTNHAEATADLSGDAATNPYCLQCHTTGWDRPVENNGDPFPETPGPDVHGYDDYFGVDTEEAAQRRADLSGVQCESCHGPMGPNFIHKPKLSFSTHLETEGDLSSTTSLCYPCHEGQIEQWVESGHATPRNSETGEVLTLEEFTDEFGRGSCNPCHTSEGFIGSNDPAYVDYEFPELQSFIGCPTCHDPHVGAGGDGNISQLRNLEPVEVVYHPTLEAGDPGMPQMSGKGSGQTCAQCHHARRNRSNVQGQIDNGYNHFGPHGSPQMDMYIGAGSYQIPGETYDEGPGTHYGLEKGCVNCHMVIEGQPAHAVHNFEPSLTPCATCHPGATDFDVVLPGQTEGGQTKVQNKLDQLAGLLGYASVDALLETWDVDNLAPDFPVWKRQAGYALFFVYNDGSLGVHNPGYANSLLDNAITLAQANQKRPFGR